MGLWAMLTALSTSIVPAWVEPSHIGPPSTRLAPFLARHVAGKAPGVPCGASRYHVRVSHQPLIAARRLPGGDQLPLRASIIAGSAPMWGLCERRCLISGRLAQTVLRNPNPLAKSGNPLRSIASPFIAPQCAESPRECRRRAGAKPR